MSAVTPIPLSLLPSTMTWRAPADSGDGMGGEFGEEHTVEHVRFEFATSRVTGSSELYETYDGPIGTVFIDAVNSVGEVPPVGAVCSIEGSTELSVMSVTPLYATKLHHTEVEVG